MQTLDSPKLILTSLRPAENLPLETDAIQALSPYASTLEKADHLRDRWGPDKE